MPFSSFIVEEACKFQKFIHHYQFYFVNYCYFVVYIRQESQCTCANVRINPPLVCLFVCLFACIVDTSVVGQYRRKFEFGIHI